jgi:cation-transporting ATPase 13A3/4/5
MQLTKMSGNYKAFLFVLAICGFAVSWIAECRFFPTLARGIGKALVRLRPHRTKRRRQYKVLLEEMGM